MGMNMPAERADIAVYCKTSGRFERKLTGKWRRLTVVRMQKVCCSAKVVKQTTNTTIRAMVFPLTHS